MMENQAAQDQTWDFMRQNFNELEKKTGGGLGGFRIFFYATEGFCSEKKAQQVEQFFQQHPFPGTERNQKEALETINSCVSLRGQQQTKLAVWLKQNAPLNATASSNTTTGSNPR
jgi:puromycin-sensitive aminopeptidase